MTMRTKSSVRSVMLPRMGSPEPPAPNSGDSSMEAITR